MVTKGIIKTIDFNGNTCDVRIPIFENANIDNEVVLSAIFVMTPGIYNGYKEGDVVLVSFENNEFDKPVILGKLYLGAATENKDPRGAINCDTIYSKSPISIPIDTKLTLDGKDETRVDVAGGLDNYKSISDIINGLQVQEKAIGAVNVKMIDDGQRFGWRIESLEAENRDQWAQVVSTNKYIDQEVHDRIDADTEIESHITQTAREINAEVKRKVNKGSVSEDSSFGWDLTEDKWTIYRKTKTGDAASSTTVVFSKVLGYEQGINTYYFTDTKGWFDQYNALNVEIWSDDETEPWPGIALTSYTLNEYNQKVFEFAVDTRNNKNNNLRFNAGRQTDNNTKTTIIHISDLEKENNAWWVDTEKKDAYNRWIVNQWKNGTPEYAYIDYIAVNGHKTNRPATDLPTGYSSDEEAWEHLSVTSINDTWYWNDNNVNWNGKTTNVTAAKVKEILIATDTGLTVNGIIQADSGNIGAFTIGNWTAGNASGIYSEGYKDTSNNDITSFLPPSGNIHPNNNGIYLGTDGIMLGKNFSVDTAGNLNATNAILTGNIEATTGKIGGFNISSTGLYSTGYIDEYSDDATGKTGVYIGADGIKLGDKFSVDTSGNLTANSLTLQPSQIDGLADAIDGQIAATTVTATNMTVNLAHVTGTLSANNIDASGITVNKLLVEDEDGNTLLDAGHTSATAVELAGWTVHDYGLEKTAIDSYNVEYVAVGLYSKPNKSPTRNAAIYTPDAIMGGALVAGWANTGTGPIDAQTANQTLSITTESCTYSSATQPRYGSVSYSTDTLSLFGCGVSVDHDIVKTSSQSFDYEVHGRKIHYNPCYFTIHSWTPTYDVEPSASWVTYWGGVNSKRALCGITLNFNGYVKMLDDEHWSYANVYTNETLKKDTTYYVMVLWCDAGGATNWYFPPFRS